MKSTTVELRNIEGTEAALGWAGNSHTLVVDRPEGKAGGQGLGFNGGQLLALAIGGCFCNDLRYVAHGMGVKLGKISVTVTLDMDGEPLLSQAARLDVACRNPRRLRPRHGYRSVEENAWSPTPSHEGSRSRSVASRAYALVEFDGTASFRPALP